MKQQKNRLLDVCAKDKDGGEKMVIRIVIGDYHIAILSCKPNNHNQINLDNLAFTYSYYDEDKKGFVNKKIEDSQTPRCDECGSPEPTTKLLVYTQVSDNKKWITYALCDDCYNKEEVDGNLI